MASSNGTATDDATVIGVPESPYPKKFTLEATDNLSTMVVQDKLVVEENYRAWSKGMRLWLVFCWTVCFINGTIPRLEDNDSEE